MSPRAGRARFLGEQLVAAMDALSTETHGADVVLFLDRLARLEAYPREELAKVTGLLARVDEAANARAEHADELGTMAGAVFDLDELLHAGRHLDGGDAEANRDAWLRDVLLVATVAPWLTPARRGQVRWMVESAAAMVEAEANGFLGASALAADRRELESPERLGEDAQAFLQVLSDLPLAAAVDRAPASPSSARVDSALRNADPARLDAVDDALLDHEERGALRLPAPSDRMILAAAASPGAVLLRMEAGAWIVTERGGDLRLMFEGDADEVSVAVESGAPAGLLPATSGRTFSLPRVTAALTLRLRVGPDSRLVHLKPAGT